MHSRFGWFLVSASLVSLSACPTPLPDCLRERVGREGNLQPLLDLTAVPELMVMNEPQTLRVFAPFTACEGESPGFRAELFDANNLPVEVDAQLTRSGGLVQVDVSYTPKNAGLHFLRVSFEPNLGARAVSLLVAGPADVKTGALVNVPSSCTAPWPLGREAVACEAAGEVSVFFSDGGVQRFAGEALVTAGDVAWSVEASGLERRVLDGGALVETYRWNGVSTAPLAGQHDERSAFRPGTGGEVRLLQQREVGVADAFVSLSAEPPPFFYATTERGFAEVGLEGCRDFTCPLQKFPLSFEPGFVWSFDGELASTFLRATPMSFNPNLSPPTLLPKRMVQAGSFEGPFELVPLWAGPALISMRGGAVSASVWPRERVLRVASNVVVLQESDTSTVRLVPR